MKKLFIITHKITNKPVPELFFDNKHLAKVKRDELNEDVGGELYKISPGPDHWKRNDGS